MSEPAVIICTPATPARAAGMAAAVAGILLASLPLAQAGFGLATGGTAIAAINLIRVAFPMIDDDALMAALKNVYDPELGINVVDLGLIYGIQQQDGNIAIDMTMITPGCPLHESMLRGVGDALAMFPGVKRIEVRVVWEPLWTPERITEDGRQALGWAA